MRVEELEAMRRLPFLAATGEEHRERILGRAYLQRFPAQVELLREGEPPDFLHVVVDGQVEIFSCYRDRETTVAVLGPNESFVLAAVMLDQPYLKSARSLSPACILLLPSDIVRRIFEEDAGFARSLTLELARAYRTVVKELKNQKLRSGLERLANWLLRQDLEQGRAGRFELPFEKKVLAARLGMVPEVLSRSLAALGAYDVEVKGRQITIRDHAALTKLAHPHPLIDDPRM